MLSFYVVSKKNIYSYLKLLLKYSSPFHVHIYLRPNFLHVLEEIQITHYNIECRSRYKTRAYIEKTCKQWKTMPLFYLNYFALENTVAFHTNLLYMSLNNKVLRRGSHITVKCGIFGGLEVDRLWKWPVFFTFLCSSSYQKMESISLYLNWFCNLLCPIDCSGSDRVLVANLSLKNSEWLCSFWVACTIIWTNLG